MFKLKAVILSGDCFSYFMNAPKLLDYQVKTKNKLLKILDEHRVAYLAGEVRTGKTLTAIHTAYEYLYPSLLSTDLSEVLFITSKKAIKNIRKQVKDSKVNLKVTLINFESVHKVKDLKPDFVIIDEAHRIGAFPKPGKYCKLIKQYCKTAYAFLLMSGTPSPESYCQLFHQFWVTEQGPWRKFKSFYKFANKYVDKETIYIGMGHNPIDYSHAKPSVLRMFKEYSVSMTQKQAGFKGKVVEQVHHVPAPPQITFPLSILAKTKLLESPELVADTAAKLKSYFHQITSGTVIDIDQKQRILSKFKVDYIQKKFRNKKLAIYYVYRKEGDLLKKAFSQWTSDPEEFQQSKNKTFICQIQSGREGFSLQSADCIIFYNISYSAVSYLQARARSQTRLGNDCHIHWIFSNTGFEDSVYQTVKEKEIDFTTKHFSDYVRNINPKKNKKVAKSSWMVTDKIKSNGSTKLSRSSRIKERGGLVYRSKKTGRTSYRVTR